jgi:hypothetical protein
MTLSYPVRLRSATRASRVSLKLQTDPIDVVTISHS